MNEPLTREEDTDKLAHFRSIFREELIRHRTYRLDLFFRLQFPNEESNKKKSPESLDPTDALASSAPISVRQHVLFKAISRNFGRLASVANETLASATDGTLDAARFRSLAAAIRRLDSALDRFDAAITASLTDVDELTGLLNRAAMERDLERELAHARRNQSPLCVAMVDADHFKRVNDIYGHGFGDAVLEELADRFEAALRPHDRVYRYGGEEFLIMLPETTLQDGVQVIERLRQTVSETSISEDDVEVFQTISAGVAQAGEQDENEDVIERADGALYEAKASGRNRVVAVSV
ncbi:diguanylate cyclase [Ectothiorhodospira magna]|uniref:diguanylate cyclase n=1 Tax=Ectothiorhodospira magna TaxID=867345 RepID=A0A1H9FPS0_9GAMM|nr:GGDEF domain-containing protein [Ectothiorhodospira magna]SEQ39483.1 diguanylate cyclase [Ectothiorhodospira magna]